MPEASFYADLHIHSKYSRATSRDCDLEHLSWWAQRKGISVVATGDFTHPGWYEELKSKLVAAEPGLFRLKPDLERDITQKLPKSCRREPTRFMLSVEISTIYKKGERTRKIHHLAYAPDFETVERCRRALAKIGNLNSDGRPILGLDSRHLLEIVLQSGDGAYLVPAHVWTPWFAVLGSKSGFDSVDECYGDLASHVFAIETGLSSDPPMNWRVSSLDRFRLISNSDAHSPPMLGREACVFHTSLDYFAMRRALETGEGYGGTLEFFPEEGKYHLDGHRKCNVRLEPAQTREHGGLCPVCNTPVTVGVLHRVEALADRDAGRRPTRVDPFRNLIALPEVMGELLGVGPKSGAVEKAVSAVVDQLGPELDLLEHVPIEAFKDRGPGLLGEAIQRIRGGQVSCDAGYDGEYGVIRVFKPEEVRRRTASAVLFAAEPTIEAAQPAAQAIARDRFSDRMTPSAPMEQTSLPLAELVTAGASTIATGRVQPDSLLDGLDPHQRAAAEIVTGPLMIVAGPGTGKTRTITVRFAHLIAQQAAAAEQCLAMTFTRRAATEMSERLRTLMPESVGRVNVTTFHGFGLQLLKEQAASLGNPGGFRIAGSAECSALVRRQLNCTENQARKWLAGLSQARRTHTLLDPEQERYCLGLRCSDQVDFDDLIALPVELLESDEGLRRAYQKRFRWVAVDEYQDVDALQYRLLRALVPPDGNLCVIGDPDQAIYGFRGADVSYFLRFREDYPGAQMVRLSRNYRSSAAIVQGAVQAIAPTTLVTHRQLEAVHANSGPERLVTHQASSERAEAEFVVHTIEQLIGGSSYFSIDSGRVGSNDGLDYSFSDFAVLYRTDAQSLPLAEALSRAGIPFQKRCHDRLADRPDVGELMKRLAAMQQPARGLREWVIDLARSMALERPSFDAEAVIELLGPSLERHDNDTESLLADLELGAEVDTWDPRADRVSLLTLHASKGLEFPVVFMVGLEEGLLPFALPGAQFDAHALAEERRLFFVGMTRARSRLLLSHAKKRTVHGRPEPRQVSRFLSDIDLGLLDLQRRAPGKPSPTPNDSQLKLFR